MTSRKFSSLFACGALRGARGVSAADKQDAKAAPKPGAEKITFEDHVLPIFRDNCLKCHNPDKLKGDQDLTTYAGTLKGGGSGTGPSAGDAEGSLLIKVLTHAAEPYMPPNSPPMDAKLIATIRKWIEGGMLETSGSKAMTANKPKLDFTLKGASVGKPEGPPPMPGKLALNPVVTPRRATTLAALAASPWAPVVALGGPKQIILYNTDDLEFLGVLPYPEGFPSEVRFSRNGKLLLVGGGRGAKEGGVTVWDIVKAERVITIGDQYDSVLAADISADQQWIALGGPDRLVKIYDTKDGSLEHKIKKHTDWVTALEFSPDGKFLVTADRAGGAMLWETASGQEMFALNGHKGAITSVSWREDSEMVLTASEDGSIKLWNPRDGQVIKSVSAHNGGVLCARFTHDGRIVTSGRDNKVSVWNAPATSSKPLDFKGELPNRVAFTHDGKRAVGSDYDGRVLVWDAEAGKQVGELESNPPTLAARVERFEQQIADLLVDAEKFAAQHTKLDSEAQVAQAGLDRAKAELAQAQKHAAAKEQEVKKLEADLETDESLKSRVASARDELNKSQAEIKRLSGSDIPERTKQVETATKKATDVKLLAERSLARVASAKAAQARWKSALQAQGTSTKVASK